MTTPKKKIARTSYNKTYAKAFVALVLKKALKEKDISQNEFARLVHKKPSVISRWTSGKHNFTIETLIEIENVLHVKLLNYNN